MDAMRELYQEVILDHNRHPRNFHDMPMCTHCAKGFNPLCGDALDLYLKVEDETIVTLSFTGKGCAIFTASASLLTEILQGKTLAQARELFEIVHAMLTVEEATIDEVQLGKLAVLTGVKAYPARVKCASLAWHTLISALDGDDQMATTE